MKTAYFTFGQTHTHSVNGRTFDKDTVVKITNEDPRATMWEIFGQRRYKAFLKADCGMTFIEWLKASAKCNRLST